jgi:lincosamide nucleotidyltransferase A/C/D/E
MTPDWSTGSSAVGPSTCGSVGSLVRTTTQTYWFGGDEARVDEVFQGAGWVHTPTPEDLLGTSCARDGFELPLTFVVPGAEGEGVVPVPEQPLLVSSGPLAHALRTLQGVSVRVVPLEMMLAHKGTSRSDGVGGGKDRADLEALRSIAESPS